jgi:thiamine biosynthesis lipoprotein
LLAIAVATGFIWRHLVQREAEIHERAGLLMGTFVSLRAAGPKGPAALDAGMAEIARLEALLSYNLAGSDVRRLNEAAGRGPVPVSPETYEILDFALRMSGLSGGAFDVTIAPLVDAWGFRPDVENQSVPSSAEIEAARAKVGYQRLRLYPEARQAELLAPGMAVDLGAIAKGFANDRVAEVIRRAGVTSALIDIGGSVSAVGVRPDGKPWRIGLQDPRETDELIGILPLTDRNVSTSGDYQRFFEVQGRRYHHLLDPATGMPAEKMIAIVVVAASGMESDALSTAAYVLGPQAGLTLVRQLGAEAVMVANDGQIHVTGGLQPLLELPK